MDHPCPECRSPLLNVDAGAGAGHTLVCSSCHGRMVGLSPFERMVGTSVGAAVWRAAAAGTPAGACPYCSQPMRRPSDGSSDPAGADGTGAAGAGSGGEQSGVASAGGEQSGAASAGLAVCRLCREVWLPAGSADWMAAHSVAPAPATGPVEELHTECGNCGAPWQPDSEGRCPYCRTQISAPAPLVMVVNSPAEPPSLWGGSFRLF